MSADKRVILPVNGIGSIHSTQDATKKGDSCDFQLIWSNLSYNIRQESRLSSRHEIKCILRPMSGEIKSGTMTAIMGPSGAGKSTLLNIIAGKIKNNRQNVITGQCFVRASSKLKKNFRINFVPHKDNLFQQFTVQESLIFSCRLNKPHMSIVERDGHINTILSSLDLTDVSYFPVRNISSGQVKRTAIAIEMVTNPSVLILDEPTSGLDSDSAETLMNLLKDMSSKLNDTLSVPAIISTIHSPRYEIFSLFDTIYLLNKLGGNIYNGPPSGMIEHFKTFSFTHAHGNPGDFGIEIANGKYGDSQFITLENSTRLPAHGPSSHSQDKDIDVTSLTTRSPCSLAKQVAYLVTRSLLASSIKSAQAITLASTHLFVSFFLVHISEIPPGIEPLCWEHYDPTISQPSGSHTEISLQTGVRNKMIALTSASSFIFFILGYFMFAASIFAAVFVPTELSIVRREISNNYYSITSFYISQLICDTLIVIVTILPSIIYIYIFSAQPTSPDNLWRLAAFYAIVLLLTIIWHTIGTCIGIYANDLLQRVALITAFYSVSVLLAEYIVKADMMPWYISLLPSLCTPQSTFSLIAVVFYGFNRCVNQGTLTTISLSGFHHPKEAINKLLRHLNLEPRDFRRLAALFNTDDKYLQSIYLHLTKWIGPNPHPPYRSSNYLLDHYNTTQNILNPLVVALTWLVTFKIILWFALASKFKSSRL